jgi:hypothetical protein
MVPLYRGYVVNAAGPLNPESIRSFGLMLADKQVGEFSLDVDWINAVVESKYVRLDIPPTQLITKRYWNRLR